jgi:hypothetical protein
MTADPLTLSVTEYESDVSRDVERTTTALLASTVPPEMLATVFVAALVAAT